MTSMLCESMNSQNETGNIFLLLKHVGGRGILLDRLINEGHKFESQAVEINYGADKMISGLEFETWVCKAIKDLEQNYANHSLTKKRLRMIMLLQ